MDTYVVDVPGAFDCYFTGTGVYAGQVYSSDPEQEAGAQALRSAYLDGRTIKRGKGYSIRVELPTIHAALVLAEYCEWCLTANRDEPDYSEVAAARKLLERIDVSTEGRVSFNGWYVVLDGARQT